MKYLLLILMVLGLYSCKVNNPDQNYSSVVSSETFKQAINKEDVQLIDVRTSEEFEQGHLDNAINIDVQKNDFESKIQTLNKSKPIYIYCKSGRRSATAANIMSNNGFEQIVELQGGYTNWIKSLD